MTQLAFEIRFESMVIEILPLTLFIHVKTLYAMNAKIIGFIYYISERNCPIDKSDTDAYAKWVKNMYITYCKKYPNGLTNGGKLMFN